MFCAVPSPLSAIFFYKCYGTCRGRNSCNFIVWSARIDVMDSDNLNRVNCGNLHNCAWLDNHQYTRICCNHFRQYFYGQMPWPLFTFLFIWLLHVDSIYKIQYLSSPFLFGFLFLQRQTKTIVIFQSEFFLSLLQTCKNHMYLQ